MTDNELKRREEEQKEATRQEVLAKLGITPEIQAANRAAYERDLAEQKISDRRMKQVQNWVDDLQNP